MVESRLPSEFPKAHTLTSPRNTHLLRYGVVAVAALGMAVAFGLTSDGLCARTLPQVVALTLGTGVLSLLLSLPNLSLTSFGTGGVVAYFLLQSTTLPGASELDLGLVPNGSSFSIEQYSTANLTDGEVSDLDVLRRSNADVIAVQGLTPDWARALRRQLSDVFPAQYLFPDIGVTGLGLFARHPFGAVDSILIDGVVQVRACHTRPDFAEEFEIIAVQTLPPLSRTSSLGLQEHLDKVGLEVISQRSPVILVGDLNAVPWSPTLNRFTSRTGLQDSRRCQVPSYDAGMPGLFDTPVEHIFYTEQLRCVGFETLRSSSTAAYLGNRATFQSAAAPAQVVAL